MKSIPLFVIEITAGLTLLLAGCATSKVDVAGNETIYDRSADGAKQVARGLTQAKNEHKRVLLQFGANWSQGCHRLHDLLKTDPAISRELNKEYAWVLIDLGEGHNAELNDQYGNPTQFGFPALVVLDAAGKQLVQLGADDFEEAGKYNPQKILDFLMQWGPTK